MEFPTNLAVVLAGLVLGFAAHCIWKRYRERKHAGMAGRAIENARKQAGQIVSDAEDAARREVQQQRDALEKEIAQARQELRDLERRLSCKEENLNCRLKQLEKREAELQGLERNLEGEGKRLLKEKERLEEILREETQLLQEISGFSAERAMEMLLAKLEEEVEEEASQIIEKIMGRAKAEADVKVCDILSMAIQRCAVEHTANSVVATIDLPNDHMKGRIIGREGRNIRTFEKVSGVDVIVDDTPGVVVVSSFDPIRREIARRSMEKLILDGRIHPARIEEVVEDTRKEMESILIEEGKQAAYELNTHDLDPKEIHLVGKLKFQSVMGQNLLQHTMEIAYLVGIMAGELELDVSLAKRCALLHDIGRSVDHTYEGSHASIGADIAKRCQESPTVVNAIAAHHEDVPAASLYATLLQIAHKISMERPGAVKEHWDRHLKRMERMENIALSFKGIESAYAIQAGREIRCIVNASQINDAKAVNISRSIARKIKQECSFPGEIKVVVVRETRVIEYAK